MPSARHVNDYKPTYPSVTYPRHALVVPVGVIKYFLKNLIQKEVPQIYGHFLKLPNLWDLKFPRLLFYSSRCFTFSETTLVISCFVKRLFWGVRPLGQEHINILKFPKSNPIKKKIILRRVNC